MYPAIGTSDRSIGRFGGRRDIDTLIHRAIWPSRHRGGAGFRLIQEFHRPPVVARAYSPAWRWSLRSTRHRLFLLLFLLVVATRGAAAQTPVPESTAPQASLVEVRLVDGSVLFGTVESDTRDELVIRTLAGLIVRVERRQIASLRPARGSVVEGEFRRYDSNATRLMFAPTGRTLRKGEGYVGVFEFLLPFVQVGVTDRFSFGAGTPLIFFGDESSRPVWLTPKYQLINRDRLTASIGLMHFVVFGDDVRAGMAYGVVTHGTADNAWTLGGAWAYANYRDTEYRGDCFGPPPTRMVPCQAVQVRQTHGSPVVMVGGEQRVTRRVKLLSENYLFKEGGIASAGVRFLGDRLSADLGVFAPLGVDGFVVVPIVNFVWSFGGEGQQD